MPATFSHTAAIEAWIKSASQRSTREPAVSAEELGRVKAGHQAMMMASQPEMLQAALGLIGDKSLAALGIQALLWARVGQPDRALAVLVATGPANTTEELNGGYWLHYGRYIAYYQQRDYLRAAMEIGEAKVYARQLEDERRLQLLDFEKQELAVQLGIAIPEEIEAELQLEMNPSRRAWHHADHYVASRMQLGEYSKSAELVREGHGFYYLTRALTGQPIYMSQADGLEFQVAQAWADVWDGKAVAHIKGNQSDVVQVYADLAYALMLCSDPAATFHVPAVLGAVPPRRADQRAIWGAIQLEAALRGACPDDLLDLPSVISEALDCLRDTTDVMNLLCRLTPEAVVIVACSPRAHPETLKASLTFSRPSVDGSIEHLKAGLLCAPWSAMPGRAPNFGALMYGVFRMLDTAQDEQKATAEQLWRMSAKELFSYCPGHFRAFVLELNNHCISDARLTTLEA